MVWDLQEGLRSGFHVAEGNLNGRQDVRFSLDL